MKDGKNVKVWGIRSDLIGDIITALPILNYLEKKLPGSYKNFSILKKVSQCAPIFLNHPLIDRIKISDYYEGFGEKDLEIIQDCEIVFNTRPNVVDFGEWFNKRGHVEESFLMAGLSKEEFDILDDWERRPKLELWFDAERKKGQIGIFPFAGYGNDFHRSPSVNWWNALIKDLKDYTVLHLGHFDEPKLDGAERLCNLSYFDIIKMACACEFTISTNTGNSWVMGAYGLPQIVLSDYRFEQDGKRHNKNPSAMVPVNYKDLCISLFDPDACDNIEREKVIESIKLF